MSNDIPLLEVSDVEWLARFIFFKSHIRQSNNTVRPNAFMPPPELELSVTRHGNLSGKEIWQAGEMVAKARLEEELKLHGRADLQAFNARNRSLKVRSDPPPENHAVIFGWSLDKPAQKLLALELASLARYLPSP